MPCGCCGEGFCFGHLMYMFEKIAAFCAMSAIISCIVVTVLISIGVGVGVGYNYCFVDTKTLRISALQSSRENSNLPQSPNLFPNEASGNTQEPTTGLDSSKTTTTTTTTPRIPNLRIPKFPNIPNIPNVSATVKNILRGKDFKLNHAITKIGDEKSSSVSSRDFNTDMNSPHDSSKSTSGTGFALRVSNIPQSGISPDGASYPAKEEAPIYLEQQGIYVGPQSPNFPESYRRVPIISKEAIEGVRSSDEGNSHKFQKGRYTARRRKEFEEIREGVKANAKSIDKKFSLNDADDAVKEESDLNKSKTKTARRRPMEWKNQEKGAASTVMPTIIIPFKKYANMSPLISKILAQNKNVTLQFITL